jgi:hypothetical protein
MLNATELIRYSAFDNPVTVTLHSTANHISIDNNHHDYDNDLHNHDHHNHDHHLQQAKPAQTPATPAGRQPPAASW